MPPTSSIENPTSGYAAAAAGIEQLAGRDVDEKSFFDQLLELLLEGTNADAGVIWWRDARGRLARLTQAGEDRLSEAQKSSLSQINARLIQSALQTGESQTEETDSPDKQTDSQAVTTAVVPIPSSQASGGAVQLLFVRPFDQTELSDHVAFIEEMAQHVTRYISWRGEAASPDSNLQFWSELDQLQLRMHSSLETSQIAMTAVNDARGLLGCDRISLGMRKLGKTRIAAISGHDRIVQRSNQVKLLAEITDQSIAARREVRWPGDETALPLELERLLLEYLHESGAQALQALPLFRPGPQDHTENRQPVRKTAPFGALVIEQFAESWLTPLTSRRAAVFARHLETALSNARQHETVFLLRLRRVLGRCLGGLQGVVMLLLFCAIVAGGYALCLVPATYRVEADGQLMPAVQRQVFAPWDGEVAEIFVKSGQQVDAQQRLLRLRNDELSSQMLSVQNQLDSKRRYLTAMEATLDDQPSTNSRQHVIELQGRIAQSKVEIEGLSLRLEGLKRQVEQLIVRAPQAGTVATFELESLLSNRPVRRGEMLLEVMDDSGPWQLELEVPEHRVGHLLDARGDRASSNLDVEFMLVTQPQTTYDGTVVSIGQRTGLSDQTGPVVDLVVDVDREAIPQRRIGAQVQAKVDCGQRSAAYVLFGDILEFVQKQFW